MKHTKTPKDSNTNTILLKLIFNTYKFKIIKYLVTSLLSNTVGVDFF